MNDQVELAALKATREYPVFGPEDDDFHDEDLTDRWWETETCWFSWNVPERHMGGWTYCQARPNANVCNGGAWVWDDTGSYSWELPYHAHYQGLQLPARSVRDLRDFEWPTGVRVTALEPLMKYRIRYEDPGSLELDLLFDAIMAPNPHPIGVAPFFKGRHFDQPGHLTGVVVLRGEEIAVDCYSTRDRSGAPDRRALRRNAAMDRRPSPVLGESAIASVRPVRPMRGWCTRRPAPTAIGCRADSCCETVATATSWPENATCGSIPRQAGPPTWSSRRSMTSGVTSGCTGRR
jgi:hypothetical protein